MIRRDRVSALQSVHLMRQPATLVVAVGMLVGQILAQAGGIYFLLFALAQEDELSVGMQRLKNTVFHAES